jgi:large subunit ribosomal protein L9
MRVILKKEVAHLGEAGAIVNVAPGYGRNYLIPKGLAIPASDNSMRQLEHIQRIADAIRRKEEQAAKELASKLEMTAVSIRCKAGDDERLFGSVTKRDIAEALEAEGVVLDRRLIQMDGPIKTIGLHQLPVRLHRDVEAKIRVFVLRA